MHQGIAGGAAIESAGARAERGNHRGDGGEGEVGVVVDDGTGLRGSGSGDKFEAKAA